MKDTEKCQSWQRDPQPINNKLSTMTSFADVDLPDESSNFCPCGEPGHQDKIALLPWRLGFEA